MAENDIIARIRAEGMEDFIRLLKDAQAQTGKLGDNLDDAGKEADDLGKKGDKLSAGFKKLGAIIGAAFATQQLIQYTKHLAKLAVQLDATDKKFKTVFGSASKLVEDFAKKSATSLGLTESQYKAAAAAAGDLLIPMKFSREEAARMSAQLINLSGALSAWTGGQISATETSQILTKALLGEREQLKTLGIQITEADIQTRLLEKGQNKLTGTALQQAKAQATLEFIMERSVDAQTAMTDSTKTLAEQQLILQANLQNISETLAKALTPALEAATTKVITWIDGLKEGLKYLDRLSNFGRKRAKELAIDDAVIDSVNKYLYLTDEQLVKEAELVSVLRVGDKDLKEKQIAQKAIIALQDARTKSAEELLDVLKNTIATDEDGIIKLAAYEAQYRKLIATIEDTGGATEGARRTSKTIGDVINNELQNAITKFRQQVQLTLLGYTSSALEELKTDIDETFLPQTIEVDIDISKWEAAKKEIDDFYDSITEDVNKATDDNLKEWQDSANEQVKIEQEKQAKIQASFDGIKQSQEAIFTAFQAGTQLELRALEEKNKMGLLSDKEYERQRSEILAKQARQEKANAIFSAIVNTAVAVSAALSQIGRGGLVLAGIAGALGAAQIAAIAAQPIPQFAKGTKGKKKAPAGFAWVGEEGPELMQMKGGEKVITAHDSEKLMKLLGGYGIPVQFNNPVERILSASVRQPKNGKDKGIDWMPLLDANHRGTRATVKKLDGIHYQMMLLNKNLSRKMTAN